MKGVILSFLIWLLVLYLALNLQKEFVKTYNINNKKYTTPEELAKYINKPRITIYKRIERGFYEYIMIDKRYLIDVSNILT